MSTQTLGFAVPLHNKKVFPEQRGIRLALPALVQRKFQAGVSEVSTNRCRAAASTKDREELLFPLLNEKERGQQQPQEPS